MSGIFLKNFKNEVLKNFLAPDADLTNPAEKNQLLEQYKIFADTSHKIEERRMNSNSFFIVINSVLASGLTKFIPLPNSKIETLCTLAAFLLIGILISKEWITIISSYEKINHINFCLLEAFEKHLPTSPFTQRVELTAEERKSDKKANLILRKENWIPAVFLTAYSSYLLIVLMLIFNQLSK